MNSIREAFELAKSNQSATNAHLQFTLQLQHFRKKYFSKIVLVSNEREGREQYCKRGSQWLTLAFRTNFSNIALL